MPIKKDSIGLRWLLDSRGLKYSWVAAQLGVSPSTLTRIMNGERRLQPQVHDKLAALLGLSKEELVGTIGQAEKTA